jgi:hypothetical protein
LLLAVALSLCVAPVAFAHEGSHTYTAELAALNGSGASGTATVTVDGNQATVDIQSSGHVPNAPHAQHIHIGGQNVCPPASADTDGDGLISVAEGEPFYGGIQVSLTTSGDVSADSAMAVDRFPVADASGNVVYSRTFTLPSGVTADDIANGVVVQHGVDANGSGTYDGPASPAGPPVEATLPAVCGKLAEVTMPDTGGVSPMALLTGGGAALIVLGAAVGYLARRRTA